MVRTSIDEFYNKLKDVIKIPIMRVLPGQLAFYLVLSIIPIISLVGLIATFFSLSVNSFIELIEASFPAATSNLLIPLIDGKGFDFNVFIFVISAFLLASNGTYTIIVISNMLYGLKDSGLIKTRIKAIGLTCIIVILLAFVLIVPAFGRTILELINSTKLFKSLSKEIIFLYRLLEIPLSFFFIYINIKLIYTLAPAKRINSEDATYGSLFTSLGWMIATKVYSYYVLVFTNYDIFYGSIANLITLLIWIYLLSLIFVIGLAFNASTDQRKRRLKNELL
ncbi:MAG: YihY/virulence factor BrkB family protein [Bacilli bacterium]|jgi:membrane protein